MSPFLCLLLYHGKTYEERHVTWLCKDQPNNRTMSCELTKCQSEICRKLNSKPQLHRWFIWCTRVVTTFFPYLNWTLSSGASKNDALHSTLMTCWTWAQFSVVEWSVCVCKRERERYNHNTIMVGSSIVMDMLK